MTMKNWFLIEEDGDRFFWSGRLKPGGRRRFYLKDSRRLVDKQAARIGVMEEAVRDDERGWSWRLNGGKGGFATNFDLAVEEFKAAAVAEMSGKIYPANEETFFGDYF